MQIVCILPGLERVSGQTRKSPKTFLFQSSFPMMDVGIVDGPGALEVSRGSRTPSSLLLPIGQSRILGVPLYTESRPWTVKHFPTRSERTRHDSVSDLGDD